MCVLLISVGMKWMISGIVVLRILIGRFSWCSGENSWWIILLSVDSVVVIVIRLVSVIILMMCSVICVLSVNLLIYVC